jgi:hypothetical protein
MAVEPFNSIGGFSAGIPPVNTIDSNGNIITNVNAPSANVTANRIFANQFLYANGISIITEAAGTNTQIQFNNNGVFGASASFTFDTTGNLVTAQNLRVNNRANLGEAANVIILGGLNGYFLQTDGTGNLTWAPGGGGNGSNGSPGGANTQVQYNDSGSFGGDPGFTYDENLNLLTVANLTVIETITGNVTGRASFANVANTVSENAQPNITSLGILTSLDVSGNISTENLSSNANIDSNVVNTNNIFTIDFVSSGIANANVLNVSGNLTSGNANLGNLVTANVINVASTLTVAGNANIGGILSAPVLSVSNNINAANIIVTGNANITGNLNQIGNANFANSANVNLGNVSNLHISGGINGYVLTTDGAGNLSWAVGGGGANGTPGGSNTQIQYNKSGAFGGSAFLTFNDSTNTVNVAGNLIANSFTMGSGVFEFSRSNIYMATTSSAATDQKLLSIPAQNIAGIDYVIISTDTVGNIRNILKIFSIVLGNVVHYNETDTIAINGYTGDYSVGYDPGNIITPASIVLYVSPQSANLMTHKMMVSTYRE